MLKIVKNSMLHIIIVNIMIFYGKKNYVVNIIVSCCNVISERIIYYFFELCNVATPCI